MDAGSDMVSGRLARTIPPHSLPGSMRCPAASPSLHPCCPSSKSGHRQHSPATLQGTLKHRRGCLRSSHNPSRPSLARPSYKLTVVDQFERFDNVMAQRSAQDDRAFWAPGVWCGGIGDAVRRGRYGVRWSISLLRLSIFDQPCPVAHLSPKS